MKLMEMGCRNRTVGRWTCSGHGGCQCRGDQQMSFTKKSDCVVRVVERSDSRWVSHHSTRPVVAPDVLLLHKSLCIPHDDAFAPCCHLVLVDNQKLNSCSGFFTNVQSCPTPIAFQSHLRRSGQKPSGRCQVTSSTSALNTLSD